MDMKIDVKHLKIYIKSLKDVIEENRAKGFDMTFLEGQLSGLEKVINGEFEDKIS